MSGVKAIISGVLCLFLLWGAHDLYFNGHANHCEMTYMFQMPQYIVLPLTLNIQKLFPKFKLYVYGEGVYAESLKRKHFDGIPVLFIPGNGGSYKQVRSLASVAYSKANDEKHPFHFDFFSLDLNEQLGALFGPSLEVQTNFTIYAMKTIMKLYKAKNKKPTSIILVGHSMGGIVAQAAVMEDEIKVPLIITQATPLARPVFVPDSVIADFYTKVHTHWIKERNNSLKDVVLVSVGGGRNDIQVSSILTSSSFVDIDATTMSVPSCWLTTDHLAMVWCRQLVLATVRALFHSVDKKTSKIADDRRKVIDAFSFHFEERPGSKHRYPQRVSAGQIPLSSTERWSTIYKRQFHQEFERSQTANVLMIPIADSHRYYKHLSLVAKEVDWAPWIFACKADLRQNNKSICAQGTDLSQLARIIPGDRRQLEFDVEQSVRDGLTHVVVYIQPSDDKVTIDIDMSDVDSRQMEVVAPKMQDVLTPMLVLPATPMSALTYNLTISEFTEAWQSYTLRLTSLHKCDDNHQLPIVKLRPSWRPRWDYVPARASRSEFTLELDVDMQRKSVNSTVHVHLILNPSCTYNISLEPNFVGIARRLVVLYGPQLPAYVAAQLLLVLSIQIKKMVQENSCPSVLEVLANISPLYIVPPVKTLSFVWQYFLGIEVSSIYEDFSLMQRLSLDLGLLPILLFLVALGINYVYGIFFSLATMGFSFFANSFSTRLVRSYFKVHEYIAEKLADFGLDHPTVVSFAIITLLGVVSGTACMLLMFAFHFLRHCSLYMEMLKAKASCAILGTEPPTDKQKRLNFNSTFLLILLLICLLNLPSLIAWHSYLGDTQHIWIDPSLIVAVPTVLCMALALKNSSVENSPDVWLCKIISPLIHLVAALVILMGSINQYRVSFFLAAGMVLAMLQEAVPRMYARRESSEPANAPAVAEPQVDTAEPDAEEVVPAQQYDYNHNNEYSDEGASQGDTSSQDGDFSDTEISTSDEDNGRVVEANQ